MHVQYIPPIISPNISQAIYISRDSSSENFKSKSNRHDIFAHPDQKLQLAITTSRFNLLHYGNATAQTLLVLCVCPEILVGKAGARLENREQKSKYRSRLLIFHQNFGSKISISGAISENQEQSLEPEQMAPDFQSKNANKGAKIEK